MKQVKTKRGDKWVENVDSSDRLWTIYKSDDRPDWLSVSKWQDKWSFSVWGDTEGEVQTRMAVLPTLEAEPPPPESQEPIDKAAIPF